MRETYGAPRRLKALLPGKRPGVPPEPEAQGAAVTGSCVAAGAPLLVVSTLHGEDSVDGTTVSFLLAENLKLTKKGGGEGEEAEVEGGGEARDAHAGDHRSPKKRRRAAQCARRRRLAGVEVGLVRPPFTGREDEQEEEEEEAQEEAAQILS